MDETELLESYLFNRHLRHGAQAIDPREDRPAGREVRIVTDDGISLGATVWDPSGRARRRDRSLG